MNSVVSFFMEFFIGKRGSNNINQILLAFVIVLLLIALWICIIISRKNRLYIDPYKKDKDLKNYQENEVV